jgi:hypothetical protein
MMLKGPVRENYPLGALSVSFEVPEGRKVASAYLVIAKQPASFSIVDGRAVVAVPGVERLEMIQLKWE